MPHFLEDELSIPMIKANLIFESRLPGRNAQIGMCSCLKDIWFFVCRRCPNYNYIIIYPCVVLQVFFGITCHWCNHLKMSHLLRKLQLVLQMRKEQLQRLQRHLPQKWCLEKMWRRWRCGFGLMFFLLSLFLFVWGGPKDVAFLKVFFLCCVCFVVIVICVLGGATRLWIVICSTKMFDLFVYQPVFDLALANFVSTNLDSADRVGFYMLCSMPYSVSTKPVMPVFLVG